jgi:hypothetical protein
VCVCLCVCGGVCGGVCVCVCVCGVCCMLYAVCCMLCVCIVYDLCFVCTVCTVCTVLVHYLFLTCTHTYTHTYIHTQGKELSDLVKQASAVEVDLQEAMVSAASSSTESGQFAQQVGVICPYANMSLS